MPADSTISVSENQKGALIELRSELERRSGEDITQGEAVKRASRLALTHIEGCEGQDDG